MGVFLTLQHYLGPIGLFISIDGLGFCFFKPPKQVWVISMIVLHRIDPILHYPIDPTHDPEKYMILFQSESFWPSKIV